ncbi:MAG: response regulator transcription factor [Ilumatobacteraceae bacterium]
MLIVEDDGGVRSALERGLTRHDAFETVSAASAAEAMRVDHYDIALVDLGLPDRDGVEVCEELRSRHPDQPIIVVTGRQDELDVVDALDAGADDYVTKPFSLAVLSVRIRRHLDRASTITVIGDLRIDHRARLAVLHGEVLDLSVREFDLLAALAGSTGSTVGKTELIATVWDEHWSKSTHTLAVHVSELRSKLLAAGASSLTITAVPGVGYRLDAVFSNR